MATKRWITELTLGGWRRPRRIERVFLLFLVTAGAAGCGGSNSAQPACRSAASPCAVTADCCAPSICLSNVCVTLDAGGNASDMATKPVLDGGGTPPDMTMVAAAYTLRGATSGLGGGRSTGGTFVLSGSIGIPQPRVPSSGGKFTLLPLVPGPRP